MRKTTIILVATLAVLVILVGLGTGVFLYQKKLNNDLVGKREAAKNIEHLTIAFPSDFQGFYPETPNEIVSYNYYSHYYEGLSAFDKNLEIKPLLAESWENPNDTTWRFRLRKDVTFHNGQKMTADDVVASFNLGIASENVNPMIPNVKSVEKVDEYTVDVKTTTPTPILVNTIAQVLILPKSMIEKKDWSHPIGTGPYKFVSNVGSTHEFIRFDNYYGAKPKVKNLTLKSINDDGERLAALKSGKIDVYQVVTPVPAGTKSEDGKAVKLAVSDPIDANFLMLDSVRKVSPYAVGSATNPLSDVKVRTAIGLALDIPALIKSGDFNTLDKQATQLVPPSIFGYNSDLGPVKQDLVKAKQLMKEAGYEKGVTLTFATVNTQELFPNMLKAQLAEIGINMVIKRIVPDDKGFEQVMNGEMSMMVLSWLSLSGDALEAYEGVFGTDASFNIFKFNDSEMLDLISKAKSAPDLAKRKEFLKGLSVALDQKKLVIPLLSEVAVFAYRDGVTVTPRADGLTLATETQGLVPDSLNDYTYFGTIKKLLHL